MRIQDVCFTTAAMVGFTSMTGGLAALLVTLDDRFQPFISAGATLSLLAMAAFLWQAASEGDGAERAGLRLRAKAR